MERAIQAPVQITIGKYAIQVKLGISIAIFSTEKKSLFLSRTGRSRVIPLRARIVGDSLPSFARPSYVAYERSSFAFTTIERIERRPSLVITVALPRVETRSVEIVAGLTPRAKVSAAIYAGDYFPSLFFHRNLAQTRVSSNIVYYEQWREDNRASERIRYAIFSR